MSKEAKVLIGIAVLVLAGGIFLFTRQPEPVDPTKLAGGHMTGKKEAKVTVVEFGDFQCPACAAAHPALKKIKEEYKDNPDFNFIFRHFPLVTIHPNGTISAEAAEAAGEQGKFWEMHDILYENQKDWSSLPNPTDILVSYAERLKLNTTTFKQSLEQNRYSEVIKADTKAGEELGVNSTPTIYVNGEKAADYNYDTIKGMIEAKLK